MVDCEVTKNAFSGLIKKPTLTDALLNRPPFKFILDVVANTISATGYLKDQFTKEQLDPSHLADKAAKLAFLEQFIQAVDDGSLKHVKAAKIVAGKDPEHTNELLVHFAENARAFGAEKKKTSKGEKEEKKKRSSSTDRSSREKSSDKPNKEKKTSKSDRDKDKDGKKSSKSSSKDSKEKRDRSKSREPKEKKSKKSAEKSEEKKSRKEEKATEVANPARRTSVDSVRRSSIQQAHSVEDDEGFGEASTSKVESIHEPNDSEKLSPVHDSGVSDIAESPRPPPPREREISRLGTAAARPQTSMGRPGTAAARPAPPKLKKKHIATLEEPTAAVVDSNVHIIDEMSNEGAQEENFLVEEPEVEERSETPTIIEAQAGGLVQKMMETKAEIEEGHVQEDADDDDEFGRQKVKVETMQKTLQNVTRTAHPLARLLDFAQEDLDSMVRELEQWRSETRTNEAELKDREAIGIGDAHKLSNMLSQLDEDIRLTQTALVGVKARIAANDEKVSMLMSAL